MNVSATTGLVIAISGRDSIGGSWKLWGGVGCPAGNECRSERWALDQAGGGGVGAPDRPSELDHLDCKYTRLTRSHRGPLLVPLIRILFSMPF